MSTLLPLHQTVAMVTARYLLDHNDQHSKECLGQAQTILRQLKSNLYTAVSGDVLEQFVTKYPKELTGELLFALAPPHLKALPLKNCQKLFDEGLVSEYRYLYSVLQRCSRLQSLSLDDCNLAMQVALCNGITQNASGLSSISLENCLGVSDEMVQIFLRGLPALKYLNLSLLRQITDRVFALDKEQDGSSSSSRPGCSLTSVELAGCQQLSSTCIRHLTELCGPSLQNLNVANTGMDCTILWYLSGYSLTTAGQLAVLANKNLMGEDTTQGVQLAELLKDLKNLQQKLKEKIKLLEDETEEVTMGLEDVPGDKQDGGLEEEGQMQENIVPNQSSDDTKEVAIDSEDFLKKDKTEEVKIGGENLLKDNQEGGLDVGDEGSHLEERIATSQSSDIDRKSDDDVRHVAREEHVNSNQCVDASQMQEKTVSIHSLDIGRNSDENKNRDDVVASEGHAKNESNQCVDTSVRSRRKIGDVKKEGEGEIGCEGGQKHDKSDDSLYSGSGHHVHQQFCKNQQDQTENRSNPFHSSQDGMNDYFTDHQVATFTRCPLSSDSNKDSSSAISQHHSENRTNDRTVCASQSYAKCAMHNSPACVHESDVPDSTRTRVKEFVQDVLAKSITLLQSEQNCSGTSGQTKSTVNGNCVGDMEGTSPGTSLSVAAFSQDAVSKISDSNRVRRIQEARNALLLETYQIELKRSEQISAFIVDDSKSEDIPVDGRTYVDEFVQDILAKSIETLQNELMPFDTPGGRTLISDGVNNYKDTPADNRTTVKDFSPDSLTKSIETAERDKKHVERPGVSKSQSNGVVNLEDISLHVLQSNNKSETTSQAEQVPVLAVNIEENSDTACIQSGEEQLPKNQRTNQATPESYLSESAMNKIHVPKTNTSLSKKSISTTRAKNTSTCRKTEQVNTSLGLHRLYTPTITSLDISNIKFDEILAKTCFQEFFGANKGLKKLTLSWNELQDSLLEIIASASSELQCLALYDSESITNLGLAYLLNRCPKLQMLDLRGACFISDFGLSPLFTKADRSCMTSLQLSETNVTNTSLAFIAKYLGSKLTSLELSWCEEIGEAGLAEITSKCTSLKAFHARQGKLSPDSLINLTQHCTGLTCLTAGLNCLNLSSVDSLTDEVVIEMARNLHQLKVMDISWNSALTDIAVSAVMCNCPLLTELYVAGLKRTSEKPLMPIVADFERWRRCLALIHLKMRERRVLRDAGELQYSSDEEYEDLFVPVRSTSYVPNLKFIDVEYCDRMKDKVLAQIVAICRGTLTIKDYYGEDIIPKLLPSWS